MRVHYCRGLECEPHILCLLRSDARCTRSECSQGGHACIVDMIMRNRHSYSSLPIYSSCWHLAPFSNLPSTSRVTGLPPINGLVAPFGCIPSWVRVASSVTCSTSVTTIHPTAPFGCDFAGLCHQNAGAAHPSRLPSPVGNRRALQLLRDALHQQCFASVRLSDPC